MSAPNTATYLWGGKEGVFTTGKQNPENITLLGNDIK